MQAFCNKDFYFFQEEYQFKLDQLNGIFGDVHHIEIAKTSLDSQSTWAWLNECLARLFIHSRLYQCSRFYGKRIYLEDICPGGCELRKRRKRDKLKLKKKFRTMTKKASMIRAMSIRESSSENVANAVTPQVLETTTKM